MTSIRAEIDASILYIALKAVSSVLDEATLSFTSDGLVVRALDISEVMMIDLSLPSSLFERYDLIGNLGEMQEVHRVTVRMSDLVGGGYNKRAGPFKRPRKGDTVLLEHDGGNKLSFTMKGEARASLTLSVPVFAGDSKDLPLPKVNLTERFTARTDAIVAFLDSAKHCSDAVSFKSRPDGSMELLVKGEVTDMSVVLSVQEGTLAESELHEKKAAYDLTRLLKVIQKPFGELTKIDYDRDLPLRITYPLSAGDLFREKGQVTFYIAPKVDYDEKPEEKPEAEEAVNEGPYVCEVCGAEIPEGEETRLEDGETIVCPQHKPDAEQLEHAEELVAAGEGVVNAPSPLPSEVEQAKEIVKEVLGPAKPEQKLEPVPVVAVDPLEAFRKKFAKKT